jgi:hypothetical protein
MSDHILPSSVSEQLGASDTTEANVVANFALQHLKAATLLRGQVVRLETENAHRTFADAPFEEIRSYVSACIMSTAASLEALINELFIDPNRALRPMLSDFETEFRGKGGIEKWPILCKYQKALRMLGQPLLEPGAKPFQHASALIQLRNALVHYKPNWDPAKNKKVKLINALKGKFPCSPFANHNADFVAMQCMSAGCCEWAVGTALTFLR